eukprot:3808385-Pyramimonas_sp.AAC.1
MLQPIIGWPTAPSHPTCFILPTSFLYMLAISLSLPPSPGTLRKPAGSQAPGGSMEVPLGTPTKWPFSNGAFLRPVCPLGRACLGSPRGGCPCRQLGGSRGYRGGPREAQFKYVAHRTMDLIIVRRGIAR